jgi:hypothetical protein
MQHKQPLWKVLSFVLAMLVLASLACNPMAGAEPTVAPTVAPTAEQPTKAPEPTDTVEPTKAPKPTDTVEATKPPEPVTVKLKSYRSEDGLFTIKYPSDWTQEQQGQTNVQFAGANPGEVLLVTGSPSTGPGAQTFDEVVSSLKSLLEPQQDYEVIDESSDAANWNQEFRVFNKDANVLVHSVVHVQAEGNYVVLALFAVPDDSWADWEKPALDIAESFSIDPDVAAQTPGGGGTPTAGGDLAVINQVQYQDSYDTWHVSGEVQNNGSQPVKYVKLSIELFDKSNTSLKTDTTYVARSTIPAGEVSPFMYYVDSDLTDFDHAEVKVEESDQSSDQPVALDVANDSMYTDNDGRVYVIGELTNNTNTAVDVSGVSASAYAGKDFRGGDSGWTYIHYLAPGDSGPFMVQINGKIDDADKYEIYVDAVESTSTQPADVAIQNETFYADEYGYWHLAGEAVNNSKVVLNISLIASVYDENDTLLDVASSSTMIGSVPPGESDFFDISYYPLLQANEPQGSLKYKVQVDSYLTYETSTELVGNLTESDEDQSHDGDTYTFSGNITNGNSFDVEYTTVEIVVTSKTDGKVLGVNYDWISDPIAAGDKAPYEVTVYLLPGTNVDDVTYQVIARGSKKE